MKNRYLLNLPIVIVIVIMFVFSGADRAHATAQISDTIIFKGNAYDLIAARGGALATPGQFGMTAWMIHTACYRGYYATYELTDERLILRELTLREKYANYLPIADVEPQVNADKGIATYTHLHVAVSFTGKLRLAKDFIQAFYIHMGYQQPFAFETILDITLREGRVVAIQNRSPEMADIREKFEKRIQSGEPRRAVEDEIARGIKLE